MIDLWIILDFWSLVLLGSKLCFLFLKHLCIYDISFLFGWGRSWGGELFFGEGWFASLFHFVFYVLLLFLLLRLGKGWAVSVSETSVVFMLRGGRNSGRLVFNFIAIDLLINLGSPFIVGRSLFLIDKLCFSPLGWGSAVSDIYFACFKLFAIDGSTFLWGLSWGVVLEGTLGLNGFVGVLILLILELFDFVFEAVDFVVKVLEVVLSGEDLTYCDVVDVVIDGVSFTSNFHHVHLCTSA